MDQGVKRMRMRRFFPNGKRRRVAVGCAARRLLRLHRVRVARRRNRSLMRYRVDDATGAAVHGSTDAVLLFTAVLSLVIGIILTWAGWRGRQRWLVVWCGGLIIASIVYIGWLLFGP